jgi:uncharacterized protein
MTINRQHSIAILFRVAGLLPLVAAAPMATAASFDCAKAGTRIEKLICADAELGRLDTELGRLYAEARRSAAEPAAMKRAQRDWLRLRDRCPDSTCVADAYRARISALGGAPARSAADKPGGGSAATAAMGEPKLQRTAKAVRITQEGPRFEVKAAYPRLGGDKAAAAAERTLAAVVETEVDDFRQMYREMLAEGGHVGQPWALNIDYDEVYAAPRFWSVGLASYSYTGGAHGGVAHLPVVIDRDTGKRVPPAGLFKPGSPWLKALSEHSYKALAGQAVFRGGEEWLMTGTAPTAENYQKLLPLGDGLRVVFEQYQVGPYAIGFHDVKVPYSALRRVLNPRLFPNGRL